MYIFDVGQADSQLIVSPAGKIILIDLGEVPYNSKMQPANIAAKLGQIMGTGFNHIDYIVASRLYCDHIGYAKKGGHWARIPNGGARSRTLRVNPTMGRANR